MAYESQDGQKIQEDQKVGGVKKVGHTHKFCKQTYFNHHDAYVQARMYEGLSDGLVPFKRSSP